MCTDTHILIIIVLFDCLNIMFSRDLLLGFLACQMNEKKAKKLHASQSISSRIRMNYIKPYIKRNVKAFQVNYYLYQSILFALFPRYIVAFFLYSLESMYLHYFLICIAVLDGVITIILRIQFKSDHTPKYSHK